ncbi:hypothetical protein N658DRAFT_269653 [Parathielavia hyrcaniae]|uniref:Uncharacterized protein n=1 Tax=Parathielavia hyrcaniae TaxID=113614 RepID=A0AAN6PTT4_9PEZI|nr:hypothetical protein N658DRAFT_269653 [Parathielavia hyrcaniae]
MHHAVSDAFPPIIGEICLRRMVRASGKECGWTSYLSRRGSPGQRRWPESWCASGAVARGWQTRRGKGTACHGFKWTLGHHSPVQPTRSPSLNISQPPSQGRLRVRDSSRRTGRRAGGVRGPERGAEPQQPETGVGGGAAPGNFPRDALHCAHRSRGVRGTPPCRGRPAVSSASQGMQTAPGLHGTFGVSISATARSTNLPLAGLARVLGQQTSPLTA